MSQRRALLLALGAVALGPRAVLAQTKSAPVLIGWLNSDSREASGQNLVAFKEGLSALGWKEHVQFVIEERWANGRTDQLQPLAADLAAKKPAIIVAALSVAVPHAAKAAPKTPIVLVSGGDPVAQGHVKSLARPGGLITGVTSVSADVAQKHLELLLAAAPQTKRVGFLGDATSGLSTTVMAAARRSTGLQHVEARFAEVSKPEQIEPALARMAQEGVQALIITGGPLLRTDRSHIIKVAMAQRWPVVAGQGRWAEAGALISYSADALANYRRAAYYVDRILKGAYPGDLPIEQPTTFQTVINRRTAKVLGLSLPQQLLLLADRVIE